MTNAVKGCPCSTAAVIRPTCGWGSEVTTLRI